MKKSNLNYYQLIELYNSLDNKKFAKMNRRFQKRAKQYKTLIDGSLNGKILKLFYASLVCRYCSKFGRVTVDHLTPLSKGGAHALSNIAMACVKCNQKKGERTLVEFIIDENKSNTRTHRQR